MKKFGIKKDSQKLSGSSKKSKKALDDEIDKSRISYKEASSDDDFATKNFMFPSSDDDSDGDNLRRGKKQRKHNDSKLKQKVCDSATLSAETDNVQNDQEYDEKINKSDESEGGESDSDNSQDSSNPTYRIQHILSRKEMTCKDWIAVCDSMYTHEITRGSVWQQPDEEYFDPSPKPVEKFLIKWIGMSYLHLSWETEKDLLEMVGKTAIMAIKKYRLREYYGKPLFEDISSDELYPPNNLVVERILDIDDAAVNILTIDYRNKQLPPLPPPRVTAEVTPSDTTPSDTTVEGETESIPVESGESVKEETADVIDLADSEDEVGDRTVDAEDENDEDESAASSSESEDSDDDLVEWANNAAVSIDLTGEDDLRNTDSEGEGNVEGKDAAKVASNTVDDSLYGKLIVTKNGRTTVKSRGGSSSSTKQKKEKGVKKAKTPKSTTQKVKKTSSRVRVNEYLHGTDNCWVTVKWEGMTYSDISFEDIRDLMRLGVDYESPLRAFYAREQLPPKSVLSKSAGPGQNKGGCNNATVRPHNALMDPEVISNTAKQPVFLEGAELRDYQWEGVRWLLFNWCQGRNSILADEMGLGKTIQTAAFLQMLKRHGNSSGPFLVVAPLSTLVNWQREINMWTDMDAVVYHGSQEDRDMIREFEFKYMNKKATKDKSLQSGYKIEVIITSPETCLIGDTKASTTGRIRRELSRIQWDVVVVDEAHKLKNFESKITACLREEYSYNNTLLLTGTPLQNNTDELWSLLNFVAREEFEDREQFNEQFGELKSAAQLEALHTKLKPYLLRREKDNVEKTVPPKVEVIIEIELTVTQKQYYRALYESKTDFLYKGGAKDGPNLTNLAMELRKCCNHPFLIKGAENEMNKHFVGDSKLDIMVKTSGKLTLLDKLLPKLKADGHRVLIFSQFRIMLNIIEDYLGYKDYTYERVDGSITGKKRQAAIDRYCKGNSVKGYQQNNDLFVMLLSTRAGGVGINLTAADVVIIFDSDWNPQNDLQAQARAHRIGQTKEVKVYRLLTKKTYETVMFKAASIKLGLDYAVMHNMGGNTTTDTSALTTSSALKKGRGGKMKEQCTAIAGITTERAESASNLSRRELENLLKHGAYDIFREGDNGEAESNKFCEETIDQILSHSSVIVHKENEKSVVTNNSFSKASFVQNDSNNTAVAIDDPEFWSKVVGLSEGDQAIYDGTSKRKCREAINSYKEPGMSFVRIREEGDNDSSDSDNDGEQDKKRARKDAIVPAEYSAANLNSLLTSMVSRGYGNWSAIQRDTKLRWTLADIAKGCRYCLLQLLYWSSLGQSVWTPPVPGKKNTSLTASTGTEDSTTDAVTTTAPSSSDSNVGFEDLTYLESHLRKFKACRVALAAYQSECLAAANAPHESIATVVAAISAATSSTPVVETPLEDSILRDAFATQSVDPAADISAMDISSETSVVSTEDTTTTAESKDSVFPVLPSYMTMFDNEKGVVALTNQRYVKQPVTDSSASTTDKEVYSSLYSLVDVLKSLPVPSEFSAWDREKVVRIRSQARAKLLQCEDLFELYLAAKFIETGHTVVENVAESSTESAKEISAETLQVGEGEVVMQEETSEVPQKPVDSDAVEQFSAVNTDLLLNALYSSEYYQNPKNEMNLTTLSSSSTGASEEMAMETDTQKTEQNEQWTREMDKLLISIVCRVGWPEGKRKLSQVEALFQQYGHFKTENSDDTALSAAQTANAEGEVEQCVTPNVATNNSPYLNAKFLTKRAKDIACALRGWNIPVVVTPVVVPEKKEKDNTAKMQANDKKFIMNVIRTVQRIGRVHSMYDSLHQFIKNRTHMSQNDTVNLCASPVKDSHIKTEVGRVEATTGSDSTRFLLTWDALHAECLLNQPPQNLLYIDTSVERVRLIVESIVDCYHKPTEYITVPAGEVAAVEEGNSTESAEVDCVEPSSSTSATTTQSSSTTPSKETAKETAKDVIQVGLLKGIPLKTVETCLEKAAPVHQLRQILAFYSDAELCSYIAKGCRSAYAANIPISRRDLTLPVWWTGAHDIALMECTIQHGYANFKKIITESAVCSAPSDFIMPPRINNVEWVTSLTLKTAEKRLAALLNAIPLPSHVSIAPDSPTARVRTQTSAVAKKPTSGPITKFSVSGAKGASDPHAANRVFGVRPNWATALAPKKTTASTPALPVPAPSSTTVAVPLVERNSSMENLNSDCSEAAVVDMSVSTPRSFTPVATVLSTPQSILSDSSAFFRTSPTSLLGDNENSMLFGCAIGNMSNGAKFDSESTTTTGVVNMSSAIVAARAAVAVSVPVVVKPIVTAVQPASTKAVGVMPGKAVVGPGDMAAFLSQRTAAENVIQKPKLAILENYKPKPVATETPVTVATCSVSAETANPVVDVATTQKSSEDLVMSAVKDKLMATMPHSVSCEELSDDVEVVSVTQPTSIKTPSPAVKRPLDTTTSSTPSAEDSVSATPAATVESVSKKLKFESVTTAVSPESVSQESKPHVSVDSVVVDMTCEEDSKPLDSGSKTVASVTPAAKSKPTGSSGKKSRKEKEVVPIKPVASILSFFKKV